MPRFCTFKRKIFKNENSRNTWYKRRILLSW
jgi:hypothetical protein